MKEVASSALAIGFACVFIIATTNPAAAIEPAVKCEAGKLKQASKYGACRLKAESKAVKNAESANYTKCDEKFGEKWDKLEIKAEGACPSDDDKASMNTRITADAAEIAALLAGGTVTECGNGVVEAGEDCDQSDLNSETCADQGLFGNGLACGAGCAFDTSDCSATRYEDTGLGSVIDHQTGLEWQKTDDDDGLTDKDKWYSWTNTGDGDATNPDGTAFIAFLAGLNNCESGDGATVSGGYAGHCDWRIPQIDELLAIVDCTVVGFCIDQSVFGPMSSPTYWSSSTDGNAADRAMFVGFFFGDAADNGKNDILQVRAVRGGS